MFHEGIITLSVIALLAGCGQTDSDATWWTDRDGNVVVQEDIILGSIDSIPTEAEVKLDENGLTNLARPFLRGSSVFFVESPGKTVGLWRDGRVPFTIEGLDQETSSRLSSAMEEYHSKTGIRFIARGAEDNYLRFVRGDGWCGSHIGRKRDGNQPVYLGSRCTVGNIIHELGHALGLQHEQTRADRDQYVNIHWENLLPQGKYNFLQLRQYPGASESTTIVLTEDYDFDSIMHSPSDYYSKNGKPTITTKGGESIGQRERLSGRDIQSIQSLYFSGDTYYLEYGSVFE